VLDVGCGPGLALRAFAEALGADAAVGVDLIRASVTAAADALGPRVALADGMRLPFPDAAVPLVLCFTTFAMASPEPRRRMAADIGRVLRPGGAVVVYDLRLPSPGNAGVRRVGRGELRTLFPGWAGEVRSLSLVPPLARRLGRATPWAYPLLARVPPLRSHRAAVLVKPS
jgi:SAM-dependent methyltransferase